MDICKMKWEHEDNLPEMTDSEYDRIFPQSRVIDGVRMMPYVEVYEGGDGYSRRVYLEA